MDAETQSPFSYAGPGDPLARRLAIGLVERLTGARRLERLYRARQAQGWNGDFFDTALAALDIPLAYDEARLAALPRTGPLVVVANHPFGILDGIAVCALMQRARPDFRVLATSVLMRAPELRARMLAADLSETAEARRANAKSLARAMGHVADGGCLIVFPAGVVSTSPDRWGRAPAVDGPWSTLPARVALRTGADVAPLRFVGENSRLFQIASHVHPMLRLGLFFHEARRRIGAPLRVEIGAPLRMADAPREPQALTDLLRARVDALA